MDYDPDPGATSGESQSTIFLSQRDLALRVPINFVTQPGVSFSAACFFPDLIYEDESFSTCFSNLLAVGFRRFQVDAYWDEKQWNFCPVSLVANGTTSTTSPLSTITPTVASDSMSNAMATGTSLASSVLAARQASSSPLSSSVTATSNETTTSPTLPSYMMDSTKAELSFPPYKCSSTFTLSTMMSLLTNYIQQTENTLAAQLLYVIINIHAAASSTSPTLPAPSPSILPSSTELLGELFLTNLSMYLYTPANLLSERTNLNSSWYTVPEIYRPASGYYTTNTNEYGIVSSEDGWPSESYIEFSKSRRLLVAYGTVDPQMKNYNFTGDESTIFPADFIQTNETIEANTTGNITGGCFLVSNLTNITLRDINSSWATSSISTNLDYPTTTNITSTLNLSSSLINCGISPTLNISLLNTPAQENYLPYQNYSYSTIWTWATNEPKSWSEGDPGSDSLFRCARISPAAPQGKWRVDDCSTKNYAACRIPDQPYNWTLTSYQTSYSYASAACPNPYIFSAPRTSLENAYLHQTILTLSPHRDLSDNGNGGVWIDFNSINTKGCWVTGGVNATCPYVESMGLMDEVQRRNILVPTIAAVIVLIITLFVVFVKVVGNRNWVRSRRRRRGGVFYEGVPS